MKFLVTGSDTMVGRAILESLTQEGLACAGLAQDWPLQKDAGAILERLQPGMIINAHQFAGAERCEREPDRCRLHNVEVVACLANYAREHRIPLLQLSSYAIFDGRKQSLYKAAHPGNPQYLFGACKWQAEQLIQERLQEYLILRLGWLIDDRVDGFLARLVQAKRNGTVAFFSDEHRGNPTTPEDVARVVLAMIRQLLCEAQVWGVYHYGGAEVVSQLALARAAAESLMSAENVSELVRAAQPEQVAALPEPGNAALGCIKIRNTFGVKQRSWRKGLAVMATNFLAANPDHGIEVVAAKA